MAETTYEAIMENMVSLVGALTPAKQSQAKFVPHRGEVDFLEWVEANTSSCFRRFEIANNFDYEREGVSDGFVYQLSHHCTLMVAYPKQWGKYGVANMRDADVLIDSDLAQIENAIGTNGYASYIDGQAFSGRQAMSPANVPGAWIVQITYRLRYDRSY